MNNQAKIVIGPVLAQWRGWSEDRMQEEIKALKCRRDYEKLQYELLLYKYLSGELIQESSVKEKKPLTLREILPYLIVGVVFLVLPFFLASSYEDEDMQVSITYDVGTIAGGVLAGSAAIIAAMAFAEKSSSERREKFHLNMKKNEQLTDREDDSGNEDG